MRRSGIIKKRQLESFLYSHCNFASTVPEVLLYYKSETNATVHRHDMGRSVFALLAIANFETNDSVKPSVYGVFLLCSDFFPQDHIKFFLFTLWTNILVCMLKLMSFYILFQQKAPPPQTFATSRQLLFKKENKMKNKNPENTSGFTSFRAANEEFKTVTRCLVKPPDGVLCLSLWLFNCASKITGFALFISKLIWC